jgi:hypothetical protein
VIEDVTDAHAIIINRNRSGSMIIPGDTLGVSEVTPALFAAGRGQRGRTRRPWGHPGRRVDDRRGRPDLPERAGRRGCGAPSARSPEVLAAVAGRDQ